MLITDCELITERTARQCWVKACGVSLTGRQRKWCGGEHSDFFARNHVWNVARASALQRDNHTCRKCGFHSAHTGPCPTNYRSLGYEHWDNWLEVNHIKPRNGGGYRMGCWNHQDKLETLCHLCHVKVTCEQQGWKRSETPQEKAKRLEMEREGILAALQKKYVVAWPLA